MMKTANNDNEMKKNKTMKTNDTETVHVKTFAEAEAAGYTYPVTRGPIHDRDSDISGSNSFGYRFRRGERVTVTVWASDELNRAGQRGAFQPMFPPQRKRIGQ